MSGYIGSKTSVTQVDGYNRTEAEAEFVQDPNGAITISGSNVGIGTSSPDQKVHISGAGTQALRIENTNTNLIAGSVVGSVEFEGNDLGASGVTAAVKAVADSVTGKAALVFDTGTAGSASEAVRIDSSGNVGIGTDSPNHRFHLENYNASLAVISDVNGSSTIFLGDTADNNKGRIIYTQSIDTMKLLTNGSEAMRINSSGSLLVGTSTAFSPSYRMNIAPHPSTGFVIYKAATTANHYPAAFLNSSGSGVGNILINTTSTFYNTSSDYRLKTDAQPMTGASARVQALNPGNFEWIASGDRVDGFLAHEAQEVIPEAVSGTKDAMRDEEYEVTAAVEATYDDDGNELTAAVDAVMGTRSVPDYQGIDQSKLVPLLTAALQEALTKIDDMETRLAALEGN